MTPLRPAAAGAVGHHAVPARHRRLPDRQRAAVRPRPDDRRAVRAAGDGRRHQRASSGTNDPLIEQYGRLLKSVVTFDYGDSFQYRQPVTDLLMPALGRSAKLVVYALVLTVPAGHRGRHVRRPPAQHAGRPHASSRSAWPARRSPSSCPACCCSTSSASSSAGSRCSPLRPPGPACSTQLSYLMLPAMALVVVYFGYIARMTRAGTIRALDADYTRTAVMKGLPTRQVMRRHVLATRCSRRCRSSASRSATCSAASSARA